MKKYIKIMTIVAITFVGMQTVFAAGSKKGPESKGPSTKEEVMVAERKENSSVATSIAISLSSDVTQSIGVIPNATNPDDQVITEIKSGDTPTTVNLSGATSFQYGVINEDGTTLNAPTTVQVQIYTSFVISYDTTDQVYSIAGSTAS